MDEKKCKLVDQWTPDKAKNRIINSLLENRIPDSMYKKITPADGFCFYIYGESINKKDILLILNGDLIISSYDFKTIKFINRHKFTEIFDIYHYSWTNFKQVAKDIYSLYIYNKPVGEPDHDSFWITFRINDDGSVTLIKKYKLMVFEGITEDNILLSPDLHAYYIKNIDNIYLLYENYTSRPNREIIQEQKDGKVVWQWDSQDHPELYDLIIRHGLARTDTSFHINTMVEYQENKLLISARHIGLFCIDKETGKTDWVIGQKQNDLGFKDLPTLQHGIDINNNIITIFNNNWDPDTRYIRGILEKDGEIELDLLNNRRDCELILYDLDNNTSRVYNTKIPATPRQGEIVRVGNNVYDINYGDVLLEAEEYVNRISLIEEIDIDTNKINFSIKIPFGCYNIGRGL